MAEAEEWLTRPDSGSRLAAAMSLLGIGWYFAVAVIGGIVGGVLLDGWLGTRPLFILLGLLLGLAAAFYGAYRALMQVIATGNQKGIDED